MQKKPCLAEANGTQASFKRGSLFGAFYKLHYCGWFGQFWASQELEDVDKPGLPNGEQEDENRIETRHPQSSGQPS